MAISDLVLSAGELVVILSDSTLGIIGVDTGLNFGTVQLVSDLTDRVKVGDSVWFDIKNATPFIVISGTVFYKLNQVFISGSEPAAL